MTYYFILVMNQLVYVHVFPNSKNIQIQIANCCGK